MSIQTEISLRHKFKMILWNHPGESTVEYHPTNSDGNPWEQMISLQEVQVPIPEVHQWSGDEMLILVPAKTD